MANWAWKAGGTMPGSPSNYHFPSMASLPLPAHLQQKLRQVQAHQNKHQRPRRHPQVQASPISGQRSHMETHFNETTSGIFSPRDMLLPVPLHVPPAQARSTPTLRPGVRGLGRVALPLGIHREQGPRKGLKSALLLQAPTLHQSPSVMEMGFWGILLLVGLFRQSS